MWVFLPSCSCLGAAVFHSQTPSLLWLGAQRFRDPYSVFLMRILLGEGGRGRVSRLACEKALLCWELRAADKDHAPWQKLQARLLALWLRACWRLWVAESFKAHPFFLSEISPIILTDSSCWLRLRCLFLWPQTHLFHLWTWCRLCRDLAMWWSLLPWWGGGTMSSLPSRNWMSSALGTWDRWDWPGAEIKEAHPFLSGPTATAGRWNGHLFGGVDWSEIVCLSKAMLCFRI